MLIQFAIFLITFLLGAFGFSQIVGTLYLKKLGGNGNTITIVFWTIVLIGYGVCMYYYLPQYIWTIIIAALLAFIMSGNAKKEAKEKMQDDSETLKVINHICATVTENDKNVTDDGIPVIPSSPSKNASSISKQSSYTKREKILCAISGVLFVACCVLGVVAYSLQNDVSYYKAQNAKNEQKLYLLKDYSEISQKALFFDQHAVIVGEDQYYYHTYDCPSRPEAFWIYNTEAAVGRGYHPCPTCNPPKISN